MEEDVFKLVSDSSYFLFFIVMILLLQIVGRALQVHGYAKTISRPYFISAHKIDSDGQGSKCEIRDSIKQLLEGACFIYKVNNAPSTFILKVYIFLNRILF